MIIIPKDYRYQAIQANLTLWEKRHLHLAKLWISSFTRDQKKILLTERNCLVQISSQVSGEELESYI